MSTGRSYKAPLPTYNIKELRTSENRCALKRKHEI